MSLGKCHKCGAELVAACDVEGCHAPVEVYSRIVGYVRPVSTWNPGKQTEFADRKTFVIATGDHQEITDVR